MVIFNNLLSDYLLLVDTNFINSLLLICIGFGGLFCLFFEMGVFTMLLS